MEVQEREIIYREALNSIARAYRESSECRAKRIHREIGAYPYMPMNVSELCEATNSAFKYLSAIHTRRTHGDGHLTLQYPKLTFLDAGCGPGISLVLARSIGFSRTIGLEIDPKTFKIARMLNPRPRNRVLKTDIRTSKVYREADAIYYFVPMSSITNQRIFEIHVANCMKVDAVIIPRGSSTLFHESIVFERVGEGLFVKTKKTRAKDFERYKVKYYGR
jgi:SAM-dependent methyltransferase